VVTEDFDTHRMDLATIRRREGLPFGRPGVPLPVVTLDDQGDEVDSW
jgi:hypothetical protein